MADEHKHGIKTVASQTGLTQFIIRAWEKRYDVVTPLRTETNRRLYSDADILRLTLLRLATEAGHNIGRIAQLPSEELLELIGTGGTVAQLPRIAKEVVPQETSLRFTSLRASQRLSSLKHKHLSRHFSRHQSPLASLFSWKS